MTGDVHQTHIRPKNPLSLLISSIPAPFLIIPRLSRVSCLLLIILNNLDNIPHLRLMSALRVRG